MGVWSVELSVRTRKDRQSTSLFSPSQALWMEMDSQDEMTTEIIHSIASAEMSSRPSLPLGET